MINRRSILSVALASPFVLRGSPACASVQVVKISDTLPGNVGAVWRPIINALLRERTDKFTLEWVGANPGQMQTQMVAGALDISFSGSIGTTELNARGADLVLFGPGSNNHIRWVVRGDSLYREPKDLRGRRIATAAETSEQYKQTKIAAQLSGFDIKQECEIVHGPATANYVLFERGDVEAVIVPEPTATRLIGKGGREIGHVGTMWQKASGAAEATILVGLATRREWLKSNAEVAAHVSDLFIIANRAIQKNPSSLRERIAELGIPESETKTIDLLPSRLPDAFSTEWGPPAFKVIDRQIQDAIRLGVLKAGPEQSIYTSL